MIKILLPSVALGLLTASFCVKADVTKMTDQELANAVAQISGVKARKVDTTIDAAPPKSEKEINLRINEELNNHLTKSKNTKLQGLPLVHLNYNQSLIKPINMALLINKRKYFNSGTIFYTDKSLEEVFKQCSIRDEWNSYRYESNSFKKRRALAVL